jgi:Sushi repeat (SCR repeat)
VKNIDEFFCGRRRRCNGNLNTGCKSVDMNTPFMFSIGVERRLYGIQFTITMAFLFPMDIMAWTIEGQRNDQSEWELLQFDERDSYQTEEHRKVFFYFNGSVKFKKVRVSIGQFYSINVCGIEVFTLNDECGQPEVPLNGRVQWNPGDTEAIYRCDDGYQLNVPSDTRQCVQGKWNGLQPICELHSKIIFKNPN